VRNPWVWAALALCVPLVLATVCLPRLARVLGVNDPGQPGWALVVGLSLLPLVLGQAVRGVARAWSRRRQ
jgi:Ca2+-transporting ATPase